MDEVEFIGLILCLNKTQEEFKLAFGNNLNWDEAAIKHCFDIISEINSGTVK